MRPEVMDWVGRMVENHQPEAPVLEVGALNVNGSIRDLFPQEGYVGLDMREGDGVDLVADILGVNEELRGEFNTVVTTETLEHIEEPWRALEMMYDALKPGGLFIGTWVFMFAIHEHPHDYWRVTPEGFYYVLQRAGFKDIEVEGQGGKSATTPVGVFATARKQSCQD